MPRTPRKAGRYTLMVHTTLNEIPPRRLLLVTGPLEMQPHLGNQLQAAWDGVMQPLEAHPLDLDPLLLTPALALVLLVVSR